MKNFWRKINYLLITVLIINAIINPVLGIGIVRNINHNNLQKLELDFSGLTYTSSDQATNEKYNSILPFNKQNALFDDLLIKELNFIESSQQHDETLIKIIILFKDGISKSERIELIDSIFDEYEIINNYNIIPGVYMKCNPKELIAKKGLLEVESALKKVYKSRFYSSPSFQEQFPETSALNKNSYPNWWIPAVGADNLGYDGSGVRVAVIDTGIYEHPDLNLLLSQNFVSGELSSEYQDYVGHGTHVAGIIGSNGGGSSGVYRGVAPGVSLINAKAGGLSGLEEGDVIGAIEWSVDTANADIISMSFGGNYPIASDSMILTLAAATENGVICVSSAGNSGPDYFSGGSPASGIDVISVGASDRNNHLAYFSSWGPSLSYLSYPDIIAPGVNIISTEAPESVISDRYRFIGDYFDFSADADYLPLSGTSMSCPVVAGALAILKQAYPLITPETARIALLQGARDLSDVEDVEFLKSGFGLINVSASLDYLNYLNANYSNVNDVAKIAPDELPVQPYDLLNFPGDRQLFNLTVISGKNNNYNISYPIIIDGISLSIDKPQISFTDAGVNFVALKVEIESDATPGIRNFELNITSGVRLYDNITVSIEVRLPEYRVLLESYHGLNDWLPELSFYQMDFYDWMKELSDLNISIDYLAEFWTPNYNSNLNNSILTEERLAQYDLVVLQNPILPYSPLEIHNLKRYFDNGGNILFLGTRYQDLCVDNINELFSAINLGIQINEENVVDENWVGIGATVSTQSVTDFNNSQIFQDVNKFIWNYGTTLTASGNAEAIASVDGKIVVVANDGRLSGRGRFVAFGDLHWAAELYESQTYYQDHYILTKNLMRYFLEKDEVSISIFPNSERTPTSQVNISIYVKDQIGETPVSSATLNSYLNVSVENDAYFETVNMVSMSDGIAINNTFSLPSPSNKPYVIKVNLTIGSKTYNKTSKILYYDNSEVPKILSLWATTDIERNGVDTLDINATLDGSNFNATAYLSIYPSTYYTKEGTINKTFTLSNSPSNPFNYSISNTPISTDPPGYATFYILPYNHSSNYYNPHSPRLISIIINHPPEFIEETSTILIDNNQLISLDETHTEDSLLVILVSQGSQLDFIINLIDSVSYEDQDSSKMRVSVNLFIASISEDNTIVPINSKNFVLSELEYKPGSNTHYGTFAIPYTMEFSSITGTKKLSTASQYDNDAQDGYLAILLITAFDSEGESEDFFMVLLIQPSIPSDFLLVLIIIGVIVVVGIIVGVSLLVRKKKKSRISAPFEGYYHQDYEDVPSQEVYDFTQKSVYFCPYCGFQLTTPRSFCPNCGKSLKFQE